METVLWYGRSPFENGKYLTYKEWKLSMRSCRSRGCLWSCCVSTLPIRNGNKVIGAKLTKYSRKSVSTLPIRNGNFSQSDDFWQPMNRKYLTYKEWKRFRIPSWLCRSRSGKYLTYKEWKQINVCFLHFFSFVSTLPIRNGNANRLTIISGTISKYLTCKEFTSSLMINSN